MIRLALPVMGLYEKVFLTVLVFSWAGFCPI